MEELWKLCNDKKEFFGAFLIDLSKVFDCMSHEILIAKIEAYYLSYQSSDFVFPIYLTLVLHSYNKILIYAN